MFKFPYEELTWERGIEFTLDILKKKKKAQYVYPISKKEEKNFCFLEKGKNISWTPEEFLRISA